MATTFVTINATLAWFITRDKDSGWWVATCDALPLTASGATYDALARNIGDVQNDFFGYAVARGELPQLLTSHGWMAHGLPHGQVPRRVQFDVPWMPRFEAQAEAIGA